jgi:hypothetical protein
VKANRSPTSQAEGVWLLGGCELDLTVTVWGASRYTRIWCGSRSSGKSPAGP